MQKRHNRKPAKMDISIQKMNKHTRVRTNFIIKLIIIAIFLAMLALSILQYEV